MATSSLLSGYGAQNVMQQLMRNESRSDSLVAMLASCNPHVGLQVPRSVGGLEDSVVGCGQKRPYYTTFDGPTLEEPEDGDEGGDDFSHQVEKKRRLTFDQVRSLEKNFEVENKLEPERKMQLAKELGLQPRQVAVWFQNRRARWKTKQLERDYELLNMGYNNLKADLEIILREKEALKAEVQRLSGKTHPEESQGCRSLEPATQCGSETTVHPSHDVHGAGDSSLKSDDQRHSDLVQSSKNHHPSKSSSTPTIDVSSAQQEKEQSTSFGSNSSDILDADSPRTTDSSSLSTTPEDSPAASYCHQLPPAAPETFVGPKMLHAVDEDLCTRAVQVSPPQAFPVKLEDACSFQPDLSCTYFLPQLDEQSVLPWWDWP